MKRINMFPKLSLTVCLTVLSGITATAIAQDEKKIERPFLWKVEPLKTDDGLTSHAYLFGTIHIPDEWINKMHPTAMAAWEESRAAYFEVDFIKDAFKQQQALSRGDGKKLEDLIPEDLVKRLDARIGEVSPLMSRTLLPEAHIVVWPILVESLRAQKNGQMPMDLKLYTDAMARNYTVGGLEDAATQLKPLTDLPLEKQTEFLKVSLDMWDKDEDGEVDELEKMKQVYAEGDAKTFGTYFDESLNKIPMDDQFKKLFRDTLLSDRNERMAAKIVEKMKEQPDRVHFFAVGTAHLIGPECVQDYLEKLNVKSSRVEDEESADDSEPVEPKPAAAR